MDLICSVRTEARIVDLLTSVASKKGYQSRSPVEVKYKCLQRKTFTKRSLGPVG